MLPKSLQNLIRELRKLPGIGPKSAERLSMHLLRSHRSNVEDLANALQKVKQGIVLCQTCWNLSEENPCKICDNPTRDHAMICVVEDVMDALAIERSGEYKGVYHVLHGRISPLNNISPKDLKIQELHGRIKKNALASGSLRPIRVVDPEGERAGRMREPRSQGRPSGVLSLSKDEAELQMIEVILATNPDMEGEATAMYIAELLKPLKIKITRIARGLPTGAHLEYADGITLTKAMEGRREF